MSWLTKLFYRKAPSVTRTASAARPRVEALEDRDVPSFVVLQNPSGETGIYRSDATGANWQHLTDASASLVAVDSHGDVVAEIPGQGLWLYTPWVNWPGPDAGLWRLITANNASGIDIGYHQVNQSVFGSQMTTTYVVAEFPGQGLWRFYRTDVAPDAGGPFGWQQLTANNATTEAVDNNGTVAAAFPGWGVWRFGDAFGWQQMSPRDAASVAVRAATDSASYLAVAFPGHGVWRFQDATGWQQLTAAYATSLAVNQNGDVVGQFPYSGVWGFFASDAAAAAGWAKGWSYLSALDASGVAIDSSATCYGLFLGMGVGSGMDSGLWYCQAGTWHYTPFYSYTTTSFGVGG